MSRLFQTFEATITVQSALHIGDGTKLVRDVDWVLEPGGARARIIDVDRALDLMTESELQQARNGELARALGGARREECTRAVVPVYRFKGEELPTEVHAFIRDADNVPYIPGSSVKGAIRTALLRSLLRPQAHRLAEELREHPTRNASRLEERELRSGAFEGRNAEGPNRDLLRLIRVSDFLPLGGQRPQTAFVPVTILRVDDGKEIPPVWAECVLRKTGFQGTISIDVDLLRRLRLPDTARQAVEGLRAIIRLIQEDTHRTLDAAKEWAGRRAPFEDWVTASSGACLLVLGWGTGWLAHTVGPLIPAQERRPLAQKLGLGKRAGSDVPFPRSVKVATVDGASFDGRPGVGFRVPLGIVSLELRERA